MRFTSSTIAIQAFLRYEESNILVEPILLPVYAENEAMLQEWLAEVNQIVFFEETGDYEFSHYDSEYDVYWIKTRGNYPLSLIPNLGYACYYMAKDARREGRTNWQFPNLWPNGKTTKELPQPPQKLYDDIEFLVSDWNETLSPEPLLQKINDRFNDLNKIEQGQAIILYGADVRPVETQYWGILYSLYFYACYPCSAGALFEIGVHWAHAYTANLWELPIPISRPPTRRNTISDLKLSISEWEQMPDDYIGKQEKIASLKESLELEKVWEPLQDRALAIRNIKEQRPLLAREQYEMDTLYRIRDTRKLEEMDKLILELKNTPTDSDLRNKLLDYAQRQRVLIEKKIVISYD